MDSGVRVYIANYAGHDHKEAKKYGEFKVITTGYVDFSAIDRLKFQIIRAIKDSRPDDWLLLSGANITNALAASLWIIKHGVVKILNFDRQSRVHREIILRRDYEREMMELLDAENTQDR